MAGNSTVDANLKPISLHLNEARPRARTAPAHPAIQENVFPQTNYGYPTIPNPFMMTHMAAPPFYYPGLGQSLPSAPSYPFAGPPPVNPTPATPPIEYPDVIHWFRFLDTHEGRNKDGIEFSPYS